MIIERSNIFFAQREKFKDGKNSIIEEYLAHTRIIHVTYNGNLNLELKRPELGQYNGERVEENQTVILTIDNEASTEINLINGVASVPLEFKEAGNYILTIYPKEFTAQYAALEVSV